MAKVDFITLANTIFKDKNKYKFISDEEKETNFFVLNRKFAFKYLKQAQFFNVKSINKASALDLWYQIFYKTTKGTPTWWWKTKQATKPKSEFNNVDLKLIKQYYNITNNDINFLIKFYSEKLKEDIKRIKKFDNGQK
jgi:hypothetical protein